MLLEDLVRGMFLASLPPPFLCNLIVPFRAEGYYVAPDTVSLSFFHTATHLAYPNSTLGPIPKPLTVPLELIVTVGTPPAWWIWWPLIIFVLLQSNLPGKESDAMKALALVLQLHAHSVRLSMILGHACRQLNMSTRCRACVVLVDGYRRLCS